MKLVKGEAKRLWKVRGHGSPLEGLPGGFLGQVTHKEPRVGEREEWKPRKEGEGVGKVEWLRLRTSNGHKRLC